MTVLNVLCISKANSNYTAIVSGESFRYWLSITLQQGSQGSYYFLVNNDWGSCFSLVHYDWGMTLLAKPIFTATVDSKKSVVIVSRWIKFQDFISSEMNYFHFGVCSVSHNCLHDIIQNKTHCGCHFISVILTKMKLHFG